LYGYHQEFAGLCPLNKEFCDLSQNSTLQTPKAAPKNVQIAKL
jgi:hypothetical protein